ncbi:MAG: hypothetical protein ACRCYQ_14920 [Nocardioides sp.]
MTGAQEPPPHRPSWGIICPEHDGRRSTSDYGRRVIAAAVDAAAPATGPSAVPRDQRRRPGRPWHREYVEAFRRAVAAGLAAPELAESIAAGGLSEAHRRARFADDLGERPLSSVPHTQGGSGLVAESIVGVGPALRELVVPYGDRHLRGDALRAQLARWVSAGTMEQSAAVSLEAVLANPDWLRLPGWTVTCLGAGAETGPLGPLLSWGARVLAVDVPEPWIWRRLASAARESGGQLDFPCRVGGGEVTGRAGVDLRLEWPAVAAWLLERAPDAGSESGAKDGVVIGNYGYADGWAHVALTLAADRVAVALRDAGIAVATAHLATPTDVFAVPPEVVTASRTAFGRRGPLVRLARRASGGRLLGPQYPDGETPGLHDALVIQQGPNYALAKRLQRWRAAVDRAAGHSASLNVAPPTGTRSVLKNRALAAAYGGAARFGVEVFEPATTRALMAALLVHDLMAQDQAPPKRFAHPWEAEADQAVHGGLWRAAYAPRSALGLAALAGLPGAVESSRR